MLKKEDRYDEKWDDEDFFDDDEKLDDDIPEEELTEDERKKRDAIATKNRKAVKMLRIYQMLLTTDREHPLRQSEIERRLKNKFEFSVERKAVARDIAYLAAAKDLRIRRNEKGWYMDGTLREHEVKIIKDAVNSLQFIGKNESEGIVSKLKGLIRYDDDELFDDETKFETTKKKFDDVNESTFTMNFIKILVAIRENKQIRFRYFEEVDGERKLKKDGKVYKMSPYYLVLWNGDYYLIANMVGKDVVTHFKVSRIEKVEISRTTRKKLRDVPQLKDMRESKIDEYVHQHPNFFSGPNTFAVNVHCSGWAKFEVAKKFGIPEENFYKRGEGVWSVTLYVANAKGLYYSLAPFGAEVEIEGPKKIREGYIEFIKATLAKYEK